MAQLRQSADVSCTGQDWPGPSLLLPPPSSLPLTFLLWVRGRHDTIKHFVMPPIHGKNPTLPPLCARYVKVLSSIGSVLLYMLLYTSPVWTLPAPDPNWPMTGERSDESPAGRTFLPGAEQSSTWPANYNVTTNWTIVMIQPANISSEIYALIIHVTFGDVYIMRQKSAKRSQFLYKELTLDVL